VAHLLIINVVPVAPPTPTFAPTTAPITMISEKDNMTLVFVPDGEFTMGSDSDSHKVILDLFWIDQSEADFHPRAVYSFIRGFHSWTAFPLRAHGHARRNPESARGQARLPIKMGYTLSMKFAWDPQKASSNFRKHGISFDEAVTVFKDPLAYIFDDMEHSEQEHREIIIGMSAVRRMLLVCFVERQEDIVRLISARPATRIEINDYEENARNQNP
jgi:uncharacterized DUF497 family protein